MKDGYYWVKYEGRWVIGSCNSDTMDFIVCSELVSTFQLEEIGDYIETPDKYKDGK